MRAIIDALETFAIDRSDWEIDRLAICDVCGREQSENGRRDHVIGLLRQEGWQMQEPGKPDTCPTCMRQSPDAKSPPPR